MAHRLRAFFAGLAAVLLAQALALSAPKDAPPESVVDLAVHATVELSATARETDRLPPVAAGPIAHPVLELRATAYHSMVSQTNAQPFITATGIRTGWGILAVSRDLLAADLPYGSLVRLRDLGDAAGRGAGAYQALLDATLFVVEDTMHPRKRQQVDVWFADYASALAWGVRRVEVEVVRYGRDGPTIDASVAQTGFVGPVTWFAAR